ALTCGFSVKPQVRGFANVVDTTTQHEPRHPGSDPPGVSGRSTGRPTGAPGDDLPERPSPGCNEQHGRRYGRKIQSDHAADDDIGYRWEAIAIIGPNVASDLGQGDRKSTRL